MKKVKKSKFGCMIVPNFSEEDLEKKLDAAVKGNIPAMLELVLHNQFIINEKLNKLIKKI